MDLTLVIVFVLVGGVVAAAGVAFGIVILAPRITRLLDRTSPDHTTDKEPGDRSA